MFSDCDDQWQPETDVTSVHSRPTHYLNTIALQ